MRLFLQLSVGLFLLAGTLEATAQAVVVKSSSDRSGVDENSWLFRAGDSTSWASPKYNDRHWAQIDPNVDLDENPTLWQTGRGWFRQTFRFRRLRNKDVTMTIQQFGQSEIYFDGRRIAVLKPARYDSGGSQRIAALLPIRIADTNRHILAVRYAFRRDPTFGAMIDKDPFQLNFEVSDQATINLLDNQRNSAGVAYLLVGVFGVLSLLHFLFYRANPTQRVNRVLAGTMLAFSLTFLIDQADTFTGTLTLDSLRGALGQISFNAAFALLLLSVYTYLGRRPGPLFWGIMVLLVAGALYRVFIRRIPYTLFWIPFVLVLVEYVRVSWIAKRRNPDPDARLPWNSLKATLYSLLAIILVAILAGLLSSIFKVRDGLNWLAIPMVLLTLVVLFSIPLGLSLSLVRDYARTYLSFRQKFDEVEQLSAQTRIQEQEKQQLLARQNEMLELQVADRTAKLEQSLTELRETQSQLVQREKLASLGELTAGIAHEIQNPLNFVTNFSEVSVELVDELKEEAQAGRTPDVLAIADDLTQNLQKITLHGQRASSIVRGMLEHSRASSGEKHPTDLNALADEYLRLAYHGLRTKDKTFNAKLKTAFDPDLPKVSVVPQEMGRVLLNLLNNAFYAVSEKHRLQNQGGFQNLLGLPPYQSTVSVTTRRVDGQVEIRVADNGTGMPEAVKAKIFQPFFTTKPTGQGTGLGLSLTYDIITKGHGGTLTVESTEGEGTEFIVRLPA
ncbi:MAG: histidine kinase [Sphingobacteriaceae bacterium]|nr:histidine kinase [Cytophagaceae bacterium]